MSAIPRYAMAEGDDLCPAPAYLAAATVEGDAQNDDVPRINAEADNVISEGGVVSLEGNTTIGFKDRLLNAENAKYLPESGEVLIEGEVSFLSKGIKLESRDAKIDMDDNLFSTGESNYEIDLNGKRATGAASTMERNEKGEYIMKNGTYSTCPPGDKSWFIQAKELHLYPDEGIGTAKNIRLNFKGIPLLAIPRFSFPISPKRKTGFLAPVIARRENTGLELHIPWYWNIRPNLDATLVPRLTSKRGAQIQSEFRYLNKQGAWQLDNEYINDRERSNERRVFTQLKHDGRFNRDWSSNILASRVSDGDYFKDLGDSVQVASITHLERRADLTFQRGPYQFISRLQTYQTVDSTIDDIDKPYKRLPQFLFNWEPDKDKYGIRASVDSELVYFDRDASVTGSRLDLHPRLTVPIVRDAWFFKPTLAYRFTHYALNNEAEAVDSRVSRNLSTLSIDSGLYFDRSIDLKGSLQTLEPRLFYLRVPYRDQVDIPLFDSNQFDFSISQLFRENRFSGSDRVADANQVSLALTTRIVDGVDGSEDFRGSLGQIFYFDDRRVTLEGEDIDTRDTSDVVGELAADLSNNWGVSGKMQWNPDDKNTVRGSMLVSYRPAPNKIVNLAHRIVNTGRNAETEQLDFSVLWPVKNNWVVAGRWNYSLDEDQSIESLLGLQYDSCCWAARLAARRYVTDDGLDHDTSLYLQLVLKGLAPVGQNYGALLETAILGYRDDYK
ncbi:MAG: LPS assembly protein LptD [Granulosicoccaceae bacterium]